LLKEAKADSNRSTPYLISANGKIIKALRTTDTFYLKLLLHVGLKVELFMPKNCHYTFTKGFHKKRTADTIEQLTLKKDKEIIINANYLEQMPVMEEKLTLKTI